jgi:hypothetical protein
MENGMQNSTNFEAINQYHHDLKNHKMYHNLKDLNQLKTFMETHVFAVWDFMSLLKRLQNDLTCVKIPWHPSKASKETVRLINEIVLGEESDIGPDGLPIDHFSLYLKAMNEVGASYTQLINFSENYDYKFLTKAQKNFVEFNLNLAYHGKTHEVAAAFFYGREKLIPDMFTSLLSELKSNFHQTTRFDNLIFYLERHIEIDGGEHSPMALKCLEDLCGSDNTLWEEAYSSGKRALELRIELWNEVALKI